MRKFPEYASLSYEQASREGFLLVREAAKSGNWFSIIDRLSDLKRIMDEQFSKAW